MARSPIIETGGFGLLHLQPLVVRPLADVPEDERVHLSRDQWERLNQFLQELEAKVSTGIRISPPVTSNARRAGNLDAQSISVTTPGTQDVSFAIPHGLGRIPVAVEVMRQDKAGSIYFDTTQAPTAETVYLKASVASMAVLLRLS